MQAEFGAAPQHVFRLFGPFLIDQVVDLGLGEAAAEGFAEVGQGFRVFQDGPDTGAVGAA